MHIYIYIYLLIYYLPAFTGTKKKKKKTPEFRDNNISNHCLGKKEKDCREKKKKKEKANFVTPVERKSRDMQSVGQKNKNPVQNAAMLQLQKVLNTK